MPKTDLTNLIARLEFEAFRDDAGNVVTDYRKLEALRSLGRALAKALIAHADARALAKVGLVAALCLRAIQERCGE